MSQTKMSFLFLFHASLEVIVKDLYANCVVQKIVASAVSNIIVVFLSALTDKYYKDEISGLAMSSFCTVAQVCMIYHSNIQIASKNNVCFVLYFCCSSRGLEQMSLDHERAEYLNSVYNFRLQWSGAERDRVSGGFFVFFECSLFSNDDCILLLGAILINIKI